MSILMLLILLCCCCWACGVEGVAAGLWAPLGGVAETARVGEDQPTVCADEDEGVVDPVEEAELVIQCGR